MKITLRIEGENKTFTQDFIPGRVFRKTLEMQKKLGGKIDETTLDAMVDYVTEVFGKQFSSDQFYDGIDARKIIPTIIGCVNEIVSGASEAVGADPDDPNV
jgi:hypothetical protein